MQHLTAEAENYSGSICEPQLPHERRILDMVLFSREIKFKFSSFQLIVNLCLTDAVFSGKHFIL